MLSARWGVLAAVLFVAWPGFGQGVPVGTVHGVTVTWKAPSPAGGSGMISGYNIYRSASTSATTYTKVNTALTPTLTFTDTTVTAGLSYNYCVTTVDSLAEESPCSAPVVAAVPLNPNAPTAPAVTVK